MVKLWTFLGTAAATWAAVWVVDGFEFSGEWWQVLIVAIAIGLANAVLRPILKLISFPLIAATLGLFRIVVNAVVLQLVVWLAGPDLLDLGLTSDGFFRSTLWASIIISVVGWVIGLVMPDDGHMSRTT